MNSEYYNNEIKQNYLRTLNKKDEVIKRIFVYSESFEKKFDKDIAEFTKPQYLELFQNNSWGTAATFYTYRGAVQDYIQWYKTKIQDNCVGENVISGIGVRDVDTEKQFRDEYFGSYNELMDFVDTVAANDRIEEDRIVFYRLFVSLMWLQVEPNDIIELKETAVNLEEKTVMVNDRVIPMGDYLTEVCEYAINNKGFIRRGGYVERDCSSGYLIKLSSMKKKAERNGHSYINTLQKFFNNHIQNLPPGNTYREKKLLPKNIMLSGLYYEAYDKELKGDREGAELVINTYYLEQNYKKWKKCYYGKD